MSAVQILSNVRVVNLDIHLWTGRKKLHANDLRNTQDLPPEDLATLGSKKICNPDALNIFGTLKKRAVILLENTGVRFLGGYAVPETKVAELTVKIEEIGSEFDKAKAEFLANYETEIAEWIAAHPGWEHAIRSAITPRSVVEARMNYGYQMFQVQASSNENVEAPENAGLTKAASGLSGQLFDEIADAANDIYEKSLMGKDTVSPRVLSPIKTIRGKLFGLSFLDVTVGPIVKTIDAVLAKLPSQGPITGSDLSALFGLAFLLSDSGRMKKHGQLVIDGKSVEDALAIAMPKPKAEVTQAVEPAVEASYEAVVPDVVKQSEIIVPAAPATVKVVPPVTPAPARQKLGRAWF